MSRIFIEEATNGYIIENLKDDTKHIAKDWKEVLLAIEVMGPAKLSDLGLKAKDEKTTKILEEWAAENKS